ncbi:MAG: dihydrofolate reductase [Candidatus Magasanikbacteria bacterium]|nr:dihydrofolate reductase [Candidatus Magasanikbacteria bacterium]
MIALMSAVSENNCIGVSGDLPWNIPGDMKLFKKYTTGNVVIMGRKTWESLPEKFRPLPNRKNIIITRQPDYKAPEEVAVYSDIKKAIQAHKNEKVFIIGGGEIYKQSIDLADTLYITKVHRTIDVCDTFFPKIDETKWKITEEEKMGEISFLTYEK